MAIAITSPGLAVGVAFGALAQGMDLESLLVELYRDGFTKCLEGFAVSMPMRRADLVDLNAAVGPTFSNSRTDIRCDW